MQARRGSVRTALAVVMVSVAAAPVWMAACTPRPDPIRIERSILTVENQTSRAWSNVEIWVNDHYRVTTASIPAGGRFIVPLDAFVAGFGQRFDPNRQRAFGVEVTAKNGDGGEVRLVWGKGRRR